jgi:hypothetical protein
MWGSVAVWYLLRPGVLYAVPYPHSLSFVSVGREICQGGELSRYDIHSNLQQQSSSRRREKEDKHRCGKLIRIPRG